MSEIEFPSIYSCELDQDTLRRCFSDLRALPTAPRVFVKLSGQSTEIIHLNLDEAERALSQGEVFGLKLAYRLAGTEWLDTFIWTPTGVRLVRREQPAGSPSNSYLHMNENEFQRRYD